METRATSKQKFRDWRTGGSASPRGYQLSERAVVGCEQARILETEGRERRKEKKKGNRQLEMAFFHGFSSTFPSGTFFLSRFQINCLLSLLVRKCTQRLVVAMATATQNTKMNSASPWKQAQSRLTLYTKQTRTRLFAKKRQRRRRQRRQSWLIRNRCGLVEVQCAMLCRRSRLNWAAGRSQACKYALPARRAETKILQIVQKCNDADADADNDNDDTGQVLYMG